MGLTMLAAGGIVGHMRADDRIVAATENPGKLAEMARLLARLPLQVVGLDAFPGYQAPEETGRTYLENALLKARHAALHCDLPCFADDSGLEVDALGGAPGLYSARFDGQGGTPGSRNQKLLRLLADVPEAERTARFRAVVAFVRPRPDGLMVEVSFTGVLEGRIVQEPSGSGGFGYDPVFWVPEEGCTVAMMGPEQKDRLSHRGKAMRALEQHLASLLDSPRGSP